MYLVNLVARDLVSLAQQSGNKQPWKVLIQKSENMGLRLELHIPSALLLLICVV